MAGEIATCKICESTDMSFFAHTASCNECGVLLCYPYPSGDDEVYKSGVGRDTGKAKSLIKQEKLQWHLNSGALNHQNFTELTLFALTKADRIKELKVLDFGGGGGQFALVLKSLFPLCEIYIVDIGDAKLLDQFRPLNIQIKYDDFIADETKFDVIFMNDVFEHVSDPRTVLRTLSKKLADRNSKIFVDTPCQFWLYPLTKIFSKKLHTKVLRGTVDYDHQQIWSKTSFQIVVGEANLLIDKYLETSEFTQQPEFYLDNMKIRNPIIRSIGKIFYRLAPFIAKNKIMAVLKPASSAS